MSIQFIERKGRREYAIVPYDEYLRLVKARIEEEDIPHEVVSIMINRDVTLLKAWRLHLGLPQKDLAKKAGITQAALSQMERTETPQKQTLEKLAQAMGLPVGLLSEEE